MSPQQRLESAAPRTEQGQRAEHTPVRTGQVVSPFLASDEAADYLRFRGTHRLRSLYRFLKAHGIKTQRAGRRLLVLRRDLDLAVGLGKRSA